MSYQVLARKWRPKSFDELVGQDHVSQTLLNALRNGRLHHAILLTGPRGTGKTSTARILAKSVRCPNAKDFVPCHVCPECEDIAQGRSFNVLEIDGASNNGVDQIRELRETVGQMPSTGRFKLYIIDEVHMLSTSAFNALLKTLEEPPPHVIFVFATTEVHKIPQTILSRCQRFDFRRIPTRQITEKLAQMCQAEGVKADNDSLWIIARQGDGSMRDSQSLLDQVITFANGPLTRETVVQVLGLTDRTLLLDTLSILVRRDTTEMLSLLQRLFKAGYDPALFAADLLEMVRHLLLVKISPEKNPLIEVPDSEFSFLKELGTHPSEEDIHLLFDMLLKGANDLPKAQDQRVVLEMILLRAVNAPQMASIKKLIESLGTGESIRVSQAAPAKPLAKPQTPSATVVANQSKPPAKAEEKWHQLVQNIKISDPLFGAKIENLHFVGIKEQVLSLGIPSKLQFLKDAMKESSAQQKLQGFVQQFWGQGFALELKSSTEGKEETISAQMMTAKKEQERIDKLKEEVAEHPLVKKAQSVFKTQIKSIKENS
ncbi:MAG: DNA polymerase III subunit gamma/tau [Pseudobdellovibrionaceae bacterium]